MSPDSPSRSEEFGAFQTVGQRLDDIDDRLIRGGVSGSTLRSQTLRTTPWTPPSDWPLPIVPNNSGSWVKCDLRGRPDGFRYLVGAPIANLFDSSQPQQSIVFVLEDATADAAAFTVMLLGFQNYAFVNASESLSDGPVPFVLPFSQDDALGGSLPQPVAGSDGGPGGATVNFAVVDITWPTVTGITFPADGPYWAASATVDAVPGATPASVATGDAATLATAEAYTDTRVTDGDAATLATAEAYTDTQLGGKADLVSGKVPANQLPVVGPQQVVAIYAALRGGDHTVAIGIDAAVVQITPDGGVYYFDNPGVGQVASFQVDVRSPTATTLDFDDGTLNALNHWPGAIAIAANTLYTFHIVVQGAAAGQPVPVDFYSA